jgi:hypothetical protein
VDKGAGASQRERYREMVLAWHAAAADVKHANSLMDQLHRLYKQMKLTQDGRDAISSLLDDDHVAVRLVAATDALPWEGERSVRVLDEIQRTERSLLAVDAKWVIRGYRDGTLDLDW